MTKRIAAKYKIDRRLGCNLWGRPKSPYNNRNSRPGQHGVSGQRRKLSDYGNQLFAKQKNNLDAYIKKHLILKVILVKF